MSDDTYLEVANDDIVRFPDLETTVGKTSSGANTENRSIAGDLNNATASESALDFDHTAVLSSGSQTGTVRDSGTSTAATTSCASGETDKLVNGGSPLLHWRGRDSSGGRKDSSKLEETHVGC